MCFKEVTSPAGPASALSNAKDFPQAMFVGVLAVGAELAAQRNLGGKLGAIEVVSNQICELVGRPEGHDLAADVEVLRQYRN